MDKYNILKVNSIGNGRGDVNIALRANIGLKISTKTTANANDDIIVKMRKSLSVRKDKLAAILNSKTFQPLFIDTNGTSPSTGTSSNICDDDENVQPQSHNEGTPIRVLNGTENLTPPQIVSHIGAMNVNPKTPQNLHMLARLQRDLDSPSAATRLRAMRALKSPANGPYNQFDVPHEEQDIITEEERQEYVPQTIQDVMKEVIVYVEVRFGDENRTAGIKEAVAELGATVNDNFNKNTTHLIFSNGTQSTYNKAKQLNIPIVSILWIEACKKQLRLVDPSKYSIHNIEQYENPELYKKVKVKKFFKTENELKIKKKKATATPIKFKPIKIPKKAKDNITGMMNEFRERQVQNSNGIDYFSQNLTVVDLFDDSKATAVKPKEVNPRKSSMFDAEAIVPSPLNATKINKVNEKSTICDTNSNVSQALAKLPQTQNKESPTVFKTPLNRKTMLAQSVVESSPNSLVRVTRRTSMLALSSPSVDNTTPIQRHRQVMPEEITEIADSVDNQTNNNSEPMEITSNVVTSPKVTANRRTIFTSSAMDITEPLPSLTSTRKRNSIIPARYRDFEVDTKKYFSNANATTQSEKSDRRRTVFATSTVSTLNKADDGTKSNHRPNNRHRTLNKQATFTGADALHLNDIHEEKETNRRKTVFAPNEASSPLVGNVDGPQNIANLRRSLFKTSPLAITPTTNVDQTKATNSKRRRTLLPTNPSASSSLVVSTLKKAAESNVDTRRRSVVTANNASSNPSGTLLLNVTSQVTGNQSTPASKDQQNKAFESVVQTTTTPITKLAKHNKDTSNDYLTPQNHTLFEEYSQRLSFSSTNKRHTDRDISLFILEQRLKNINEMARLNRSVSESDVNVANIEKRINERVARSSPHLLQPENGNNVDQDVLPPPPKKRKLFNPHAYEEQVAMQSTDSGDNNNKAAAGSADKSPTQKTKNPCTAPPMNNKRSKQRRSTMDFKTDRPKPVQVYASITKSNSSMNYLAYSNMNRDQVNVINEAIATLGKFTVESNVTKKTTHLVTVDAKRTQKFLRAIIRGLWIISYDWVTESLQAGTWLYEEPFENRSVSNAVSVCRAESQAFGSKYKIEIFGHIDPIYISTKCKCPALKELYTMCGGRVTNSRLTAKYIVADKYKDNVNQRCLHSDWILDSITAASCKNLASYILKSVPVSV